MAEQERTLKQKLRDEQSVETKRTSKKVSDHLANERTFLAWIRTGIAIMAFGFVVARFGLLLREMALKSASFMILNLPFSSFIGVLLVLFGTIIIVVALMNFAQIRAQIDLEEFHPQMAFPIVLTALSCVVGIVVALYLVLTA